MKLFQKQITQLSLKSSGYRKFVTELLELLFSSDLGGKDITTALFAAPSKTIQAQVIAKENGILAGMEEVVFFLKKKGVQVSTPKKDGMKIRRGEVVATIKGPANKVLAVERLALNVLGRMSGIATSAARLAKQVGKGKFAATRKTPLGLLDSKAVVVGGGLPHRLNLSDQILVKDNHLAVDPAIWKRIRTQELFEAEASSSRLAVEIAKHFSKNKNLILLLDNFTPAQLRKLVPALRTINPKIILEASGGVVAKNAKAFLKSGVDFVSLGELTHSAKAVDFSLRFG
ncbi:MAG: carboxylating nicotinate-nucleotide diphosphorylase [Patescibacteria group bacterium]